MKTKIELVGLDALNHFPFSKLKEPVLNNYTDRPWLWKQIEGWGELNIPQINEGLRTFWSANYFVEFVSDFKHKYGEDPIFIVNSDEIWFNKIQIKNERFNFDRDNHRVLNCQVRLN